MVQLKQGFPGLALGDFTTLQTMQITQVGQDTDGRITIQCADVQRFIQGMQIWLRGGPLWWTPGGPKAQQPVGASWLENGYQVSDQNPRYVAGNPIDIILAVLQNELGVGQDPGAADLELRDAEPRAHLPVAAELRASAAAGRLGDLSSPARTRR